MFLNSIALKLSLNPKRLFLLDGIGALISALFLGMILPAYANLVGLPIYLMKFLASLALVLCIYSLACYFLLPKLDVKQNSEYIPNIKIMIYSNITYVILTVGLIIYHYKKVKIYGMIYFLGEIITMMFIIVLEQQVMTHIRKSS